MPEKGFTATFISNSGKTHYQFNISGWKLHLTRIILALFVLSVSAAVVIVALGLIESGETERLREEISSLQDSLATRRNIEARLENVEEQLEQLGYFRQRIENIAGTISPQLDSPE
ncbi:MAG: hypothetical protein KAQ97_04085 [Candidatus Fermentibacteraceae bacterium]|nr:hypothetical protein [Candidatus Fermentibacteraceae bacterium]